MNKKEKQYGIVTNNSMIGNGNGTMITDQEFKSCMNKKAITKKKPINAQQVRRNP